MTLDPHLRDELAAIAEPQLVRSLEELGFLGEVSEENGVPRVELVLPVTNWPHLETLRESVLAKVPGADVVVRTMNDDERLAHSVAGDCRRNVLQCEMRGDQRDTQRPVGCSTHQQHHDAPRRRTRSPSAELPSPGMMSTGVIVSANL